MKMIVNPIWKHQIWRWFVVPIRGLLAVLPIGTALLNPSAFAQIIPDSTLGSESSQVTPDVNIRGQLGDRIDGGAVRGSALFHSFSEFNVNNGQRVYFADPAGIANIFSRVTDSNVSNILGTLGVDGAANLFPRRLEMDRATIRSEAENSQAGDINLTLNDLLLLRHGSLISTTANTGNGGNITISAPFVIAVPSENSDIIANAVNGNGGQINITANRIFGLKQQSGQDVQTLRRNNTSDISASSEFGLQGNINIQALSIDPSQGLTALPIDLIDPSNQITKSCGAGADRQNQFVVTGRGGLPPSPDDLQTARTTSPGWVTRDVGNVSRANIPDELRATASTDTLVEAQGMVKTANGGLLLTAQSATATPDQSGLSNQFCSPTSHLSMENDRR